MPRSRGFSGAVETARFGSDALETQIRRPTVDRFFDRGFGDRAPACLAGASAGVVVESKRHALLQLVQRHEHRDVLQQPDLQDERIGQGLCRLEDKAVFTLPFEPLIQLHEPDEERRNLPVGGAVEDRER